MTEQDLFRLIHEVPDFPEPGVNFKDITPLLANPSALHHVVERFAAVVQRHSVDALVAIESRGFIFGAALSQRIEKPLVLARKPGKLPREVASEPYQLEYGTTAIEVHQADILPGRRYAIVDDVIATGGTAQATSKLVGRLGGNVVCCVFLIELTFLAGRDVLGNLPVESLISYSS